MQCGIANYYYKELQLNTLFYVAPYQTKVQQRRKVQNKAGNKPKKSAVIEKFSEGREVGGYPRCEEEAY